MTVDYIAITAKQIIVPKFKNFEEVTPCLNKDEISKGATFFDLYHDLGIILQFSQDSFHRKWPLFSIEK